MIISFRNLSPITSFEEIQTYLETFGEIKNLSIGSYVMNNQTKCFGQVEIISSKAGLLVIADLQHKIIDGNKLIVRKDSK